MAKPPNYTKNPKGYNDKLFANGRTVRRAFMELGYPVNLRLHEIPQSTVREFQRDYSKCGNKFSQWGEISATGLIDKDTFNALEIALRWTKKKEKTEGTPSSQSWQSLCKYSESEPQGKVYASTPEASDAHETRYVEISPQGLAKLKSTETDICFRAKVIGFERDGNVAFAIVTLPSQADLPGGRGDPIRCPCIFGR